MLDCSAKTLLTAILYVLESSNLPFDGSFASVPTTNPNLNLLSLLTLFYFVTSSFSYDLPHESSVKLPFEIVFRERRVKNALSRLFPPSPCSLVYSPTPFYLHFAPVRRWTCSNDAIYVLNFFDISRLKIHNQTNLFFFLLSDCTIVFSSCYSTSKTLSIDLFNYEYDKEIEEKCDRHSGKFAFDFLTSQSSLTCRSIVDTRFLDFQ